MSRRRGEFEHRTSIFEGAFRAWSHLGGIAPTDLETKAISELDPLTFPHEYDDRPRLGDSKDKNKGGGGGAGGGSDSDDIAINGGERRDYPYEPLPRSGLAHPFVQAILSPWLGPDADQDAIQLGLTTLRTWWQHRRKGESGSAVAALGTDKMRGVVEGYTRHFFHLAYCLIVNDKEQPPRTLQTKISDAKKGRGGRKGGGGGGGVSSKKRSRDVDDTLQSAAMAYQSGLHGGVHHPRQNDRLHDQLMMQGQGMMQFGGETFGAVAPFSLHEAQRQHLANQSIAMAGGGGANFPVCGGIIPSAPSSSELPTSGIIAQVSKAARQIASRTSWKLGTNSKLQNIHEDPSKYGDPHVTPIVLVTMNQLTKEKDMQLCMAIDGITSPHCVKIIETVLKGCPGRRAPIDGILDVAADMDSSIVIVKIANIRDSRRIAFESTRNLSMVGFTATTTSYTVPSGMSLETVYGLMERTIPSVGPMEQGFNWNLNCVCQEINVKRVNCHRHSQFVNSIELIEGFTKIERLLSDPVILKAAQDELEADIQVHAATARQHMEEYKSYQMPIHNEDGNVNGNALNRRGRPSRTSIGRMSFGGLLGGAGRLFSETTFGRSMSGLSALSIDWENIDGFDVSVDHSAGINNDIIQQQQKAEERPAPEDTNDVSQENEGRVTRRRSSMRNPESSGPPVHNVTFK